MSYPANEVNEKSEQLQQAPPPSYNQFSRNQPQFQGPQQPAMVVAQPQFVQQQQYMVQPYSAGQMVMVPPRMPVLPRELQPNDYIVVSLVVAIACGFLNITSLFFSIPAVACSVIAFERRSNGIYETARKLGYAAIILDLLTVTWVMIWSVIATGLIAACVYEAGPICRRHYYYYYYK